MLKKTFLNSIFSKELQKSSFEEDRPKSRFQIEHRIKKIEDDGYFGNHKFLEDNIWELKFNDGANFSIKGSNVLIRESTLEQLMK